VTVREVIQGAPRDSEVLIELPQPLEPVSALRSTLITSSLASLRSRGLFARYDKLQRSPHREVILSSVAGGWLDIDVASAHYQACDALGLTRDEQIDIGKDVSKRIHETFLRTILSAARGVGLTPWVLLRRSDSVQTRLNRGGGVRLTRISARVARIEVVKHPLLDLSYFRHGLLGMYVAAVELMASNVSGQLLHGSAERPSERTVLRIEWT
jgi:hypothetical protein